LLICPASETIIFLKNKKESMKAKAAILKGNVKLDFVKELIQLAIINGLASQLIAGPCIPIRPSQPVNKAKMDGTPLLVLPVKSVE
jgi:hypothetical protein